MAKSFPITGRTRMRRKANRATYDRKTIHAILDEALIASVAIAVDGRPQVQPMIHVRDGDRLILHGLATNALLSAIAAGAEACINVTIIHALAIARRIEDHSMHYRSVTIYGRGTLVAEEPEKLRLMQHVFASLVGEARYSQLEPLEPSYLKGTMVVVVPIEEAVGKVNQSVETWAGPAGIWSGLLPVDSRFGPPLPDDRSAAESIACPSELSSYRR